MTRKKLEFSIEDIQILDEQGNVDESIMPTPLLTDKQVQDIFELMIFAETFDNKCVILQRQGRMGTYASGRGEEATAVTAAYLLEKDDWIAPSYREAGAWIAKGYPLHKLILYWAGSGHGMTECVDYKILPISIPVGTQIIHATGLGWGLKLKKKTNKNVVLCFFGDGATSTGDFHEGLNFAGVYQTPTIFLCRNNQYAISVPVKHQTASETIAQKAIAYGITGIKVDGNDIFAMAYAMKQALEHARNNKPFFIEAFTYRLVDHTTSDDGNVYRDKKEVEEWKKKGPIIRVRKYMKKKKLWTQAYEDKLIKKFEKKIDEAVQKEEATEERIEFLSDHVFDKPNKLMIDDLKELQEHD